MNWFTRIACLVIGLLAFLGVSILGNSSTGTEWLKDWGVIILVVMGVYMTMAAFIAIMNDVFDV